MTRDTFAIFYLVSTEVRVALSTKEEKDEKLTCSECYGGSGLDCWLGGGVRTRGDAPSSRGATNRSAANGTSAKEASSRGHFFLAHLD